MTSHRRRTLLALVALVALVPLGAARAARVVAVGDVHGEIDGLESVLRAASLIDQEGNWSGGDAVLVQTGDVTDRGARVRAVMDRLRALERQAPAQGGRVVVTLGNHEVSNLIHVFDYQSTPFEVFERIWADFADKRSGKRQRAAYTEWFRWLRRYPGCVQQQNAAWREDRRAWLADHPPGFVEYVDALSATGEYGRWLRGLGVAAEIDGDVFLHGGLSPELLERGLRSVADLNREARQALERFDADRRRLIDEEVIVPFSTLWELHCAVFVEVARLEESRTAESMRRRVELEELRARLPGSPGWFLTEESGPLWYRGLATGDETQLAPRLEEVLAAFSARRIAVGHTPQLGGRIVSRFGGRVFLLDTAMAYPELGGRAAALELAGGRATAIYADERLPVEERPAAVEPAPEAPSEAPAEAPPRAPEAQRPEEDSEPPAASNGPGRPALESSNGHEDLESSNGHEDLESGNGQESLPSAPPEQPAEDPEEAGPGERRWLGADGEPLPFTDFDPLLEFLAEATVVRTSSLKTGITLPRKVLLERDGVQAHAIFHDIAIEKRQERLRGGKVVNFFRDHYANNVAAFELSRMLGMDNVPPAVVRRVERKKGSLQLWIEGSRTEEERRRLKVEPPGEWRLVAKDMVVFDNLVNNIDRNQGNILFDADWKLWFIDHTRTFGRTKQLPQPERIIRCSRGLYRALRELDEQAVRERLKPYIGIFEIGGLMARRKRLVELLEARIAELGEFAVLFDYGDPAAAAAAPTPDVPEAPPEP